MIRAFWPQAEFHARKFLELCTDHPERLVDHCFQHSGAVIFRIAYGYTAKNYDDEWIKTTNDALHTFNTVTALRFKAHAKLTFMQVAAPGAYLVNQFPFCTPNQYIIAVLNLDSTQCDTYPTGSLEQVSNERQKN